MQHLTVVGLVNTTLSMVHSGRLLMTAALNAALFVLYAEDVLSWSLMSS